LTDAGCLKDVAAPVFPVAPVAPVAPTVAPLIPVPNCPVEFVLNAETNECEAMDMSDSEDTAIGSETDSDDGAIEACDEG
jgi:hypothetical protein